MKGTDVQPQTDVSQFASSYGVCSRCRRTLSRSNFDTDQLGRLIESCPSCGPALVPRRSGGLKKNATHPMRMIGTCHCGQPVMWRGTGLKPEECPVCSRLSQAKRLQSYNTARTEARKASESAA